MLNRDQYNHWLTIARRYSRRRGEAEDLLHDSLLAAVQCGREDLGEAKNRAWLAGVIRNKAAMAARGAGRRRRREALPRQHPQPVLPAADEPTFDAIHQLPKGARIVAILALHGLNRAEIADILGLSPAALRQRLTTLRKRWQGQEPPPNPHLRTLGDNLEHGLIRRSLIAFLLEMPGVGTHDPDGHLIVLGKSPPSQIGSRRQL